MQTKLHMNLTQGIVDVEGDVEFVRAVYDDFKDRLTKHSTTAPEARELVDAPSSKTASAGSTKSKRRGQSRKKAAISEAGETSVNPDTPKLDKTVDTSKLKGFYDQFDPSSAPEKILIFLKYLIDIENIPTPNIDQIYTCFRAIKEKVPSAYSQAFRDTASKKGFIDYNSATDIKITILGENHFEHSLKKKAAE